MERLEKKSLAAISPHSPTYEPNPPHEEMKELSINMTKIENDGIVEKNQGFSEIYTKKLDHPTTNIKKNMHSKHDSFGGTPQKPSALKKNLTLKIDQKDVHTVMRKTQTSKTFYSPQKKIESPPKKLSIPPKEKEKISTSTTIKLEKVGNKPNGTPRKK